MTPEALSDEQLQVLARNVSESEQGGTEEAILLSRALLSAYEQNEQTRKAAATTIRKMGAAIDRWREQNERLREALRDYIITYSETDDPEAHADEVIAALSEETQR